MIRMKALEKESTRRLPAGPHGISPDLVARNQRERLIAAMAEVCAKKSYAEVSVAEVVALAGVSTATFYKRFDGKRECLAAAHEELFGRLLEEVDAACAGASAGEQGLRLAIRTALALLAADPQTARLLTVEILAIGLEGSRLHAEAIEALARRLGGDSDPNAKSPDVPPSTWASVAGMAALVARLVMAGEAAALPGLEDELVAKASATTR